MAREHELPGYLVTTTETACVARSFEPTPGPSICRIYREKGFRIGYNNELVELQFRGANMSSATKRPEIVEKYLLDELLAKWIIRVQDSEIHCIPFGVIPNRSSPNKWRLISLHPMVTMSAMVLAKILQSCPMF